ncbi:hypothetical protein IW262DRAFT_1412105 [Armillaria fumosa]|nr:hypothetical protein IW262DRAFT_1412105 [Armillaria fumosa]
MKTKGPMGKRVSADENQSTRTVGMYWVDKTLNLVKEIEADRTVKEAMDDVAAALGAHIYTTYKMTKSVPDWNDVAADFVCYPFVEPDTKLCDLPPHTGIGSNEEDLTILLRPKLASPMISAFIPLRLENAKLRGGLLVPVGPPSVEDTSPSLRDLMKEIDNLKTARDDDQKQRTEDRIEHATEISRLERQYATDISRAERQHATDISRLEKQHATETARLEKQRTEDRVERATEISRLEGQHATEIARLERQHATKISVLEKASEVANPSCVIYSFLFRLPEKSGPRD